MPTPKKKETVKDLQRLLADSSVLIFTDYRGLRVADITNLRRQLREKGVEYHVAKNTLAELAAHRAGVPELSDMLDGPTAIAFVSDDIPGAAKVLSDFARTSRILQIRGALLGRSRLSPDQVGDLTRIQSRETYIAGIVGSLQSPVAGLVGTLNGIVANFLYAIQARIDQLQQQGEGGGGEAGEAGAPAPTPAS